MKRFYTDCSAVAEGLQWQVLLDGRKVRTQAGLPQLVPSLVLADAMAAEWDAQGDTIDSGSFPLRDLADYAIDVVRTDPGKVADDLLRFAETDTLCYRAEPDEALGIRQRDVWEPLVLAVESRLDVRFIRLAGVIHRPQPGETIAALRAEMLRFDAFELAALHTLASLAASLVIGLAALDPAADAEALFAASNLEEDWQAELWGKDDAAIELRARRLAGFCEAARFVHLARDRGTNPS
ncbi:ATP12 family protein [Novosphingobium sp.]|uniref:ATP12 family chaperone protein n=1 Tax=Novosphingobium sp. TaxID=1874826 RepID=UPI0025DA433D|nr:ATP12 family protein [Novosphingobium sp.]